jgi:hypothetical protein
MAGGGEADMATVKDQLQAAKQTLYEEISEAIERYQTETGVTIVRVAYVHSDYAKPPKTHFIGFSMKTDLD